MRIVHLISGGDIGGAKTHVITLLNALQEYCDVELVCLSDGVFYQDALKAGITSRLIVQHSRFDLSIMKKLQHFLKETSTDILHCHGARANFIARLLKPKVAIPFVTTIHSDIEHDFDQSFIKRIIFTNLNKWGLKTFDHYFPVTNTFRSLLVSQNFDRRKLHVIYNGIKIPDNIQTKSKIDTFPYTELNISPKPNTMIFGTATRFHPVKGIDILLKACKILKDMNSDFILLIAGIGDEKYRLKYEAYVEKENLEKHVFFLGFLNDIHIFYDTIDVNLLTSYSESFPYALLEGGIHALPTIASRAGGVVEMIEDKISGLLFDVGDYESLAKKMNQVITSPAKAEKLGHNFKSKIINDFSDIAMAKRHFQLYTTILLSDSTNK